MVNSTGKITASPPALNTGIKKHRLDTKSELLPEIDLNAIIDKLGHGIRIISNDYTVLHINRAFSELSGVSPGQARGQKCWKVFKSPFCHTSECRLKRVFSEEQAIQVEIERTKPDGTIVPCMVSAFPLKASDGAITGIMESFRDITENRRLLARVRESEEMYRSLIELGSEVGEAIVMLQDVDGCEAAQVYVSDHWLKITGYNREELLRRSFIDLILPQEREIVTLRYRQRMSGRVMLGLFEINIKNKAGKIIPIEYTAALSVYSGKPADVVYIRDISERKKMEEEIKESEQRYQALVNLGTEASEAVVMVEDRDGKEGLHAFASNQWLKMTGYTREELSGMTFRDLLHPRDRKASLARHRLKILGKTVPGLYEMTVIRKDNKEVPIELTGAYTTYKGRRVTVNYIRDITERKLAEQNVRQAEEKIRESEERYRSLFEDVPVAIYEMDYSDVRARIEQIRSKGITDFETYFNDNWNEFVKCFNLRKVIGQNNAVVTTLKAQNKEHVEKCIQKFLEDRPTGLRRDLENLLALIKGEQKIFYQTYQPNFQGDWQYLNVYFVLAPGHEQDWSRVFLSFWDVTEQVNAGNELKKYQAQLEEMVNERTIQLSYEVEKRKEAEAILKDLYSQELALRKRLEEQNKQRTEFTRALVHEIKTPLTSVMAASELLLSEFHDEPQRTLAKHIFEGSIELNARTDELFDLAKGELGLLKLKKSDVDPVTLIRDVLVTIDPAIKEKKQRLIRKGCWSLPKIWADGTRLRQVLLNILNNAIKYTPVGGMISVTATNPGEKLHIKISDNGPGISIQDQKWVFEPYHRLQADGSFSGLGLGLSISKTLVELHGGEIWVESDEGRGTSIHISLPLKESEHRLG